MNDREETEMGYLHKTSHEAETYLFKFDRRKGQAGASFVGDPGIQKCEQQFSAIPVETSSEQEVAPG